MWQWALPGCSPPPPPLCSRLHHEQLRLQLLLLHCKCPHPPTHPPNPPNPPNPPTPQELAVMDDGALRKAGLVSARSRLLVAQELARWGLKPKPAAAAARGPGA